jgi:hypothetical protein
MYDFKIRCLLQSLYSIFFNQGTKSIKESLQLLRRGESPNISGRQVELINTAIGYVVMLMITVSKISRINYSCMYKYFGSRSSLMAKDKGRSTFGAYLEGRGLDLAKAKLFLEAICLDAVKILEVFKVDIGVLHTILFSTDLFRCVETFKQCLFKRIFVGPQSTPSLEVDSKSDQKSVQQSIAGKRASMLFDGSLASIGSGLTGL